MNESNSRVLIWFSCGAASAVAAKMAIEKYGKERCEVVYSDTSEDEHPDNLRFLRDVEKWLGVTVTFLKSTKYKNVDDVIEKTGFIVGNKHAPCTLNLKIKTRLEYQKSGDIHVFGYTVEEKGRMLSFESHNSFLEYDWILAEENITKNDCHRIIEEAGIKPNAMYLMGFPNANCIGCVRAANFAYWGLIKKYYPDIYDKRARQERTVGATINMDQRGGKRTPIYLDEMNEDTYKRGRNLKGYNFSCGALCSTPLSDKED